MRDSTKNSVYFHMEDQAYKRVSRLTLLMLGAFGICMLAGLLAALLLWPTYPHAFTFYLKWQDALVGACGGLALLALGGCILALRFLYALLRGRKEGMLSLENGNLLSGRDLSPKNFVSIFWAVATTYACFLALLVVLLPGVIVGWTLHLPNPALVFFATLLALIISLSGFVLAIPCIIFFVVGLIGGVSFCRRLGARQTYALNSQTTLRVDGFALAVVHPDQPESLFDLQMLSQADQHLVLTRLRQRWSETEGPANPAFGDEIAALLFAAPAEKTSFEEISKDLAKGIDNPVL